MATVIGYNQESWDREAEQSAAARKLAEKQQQHLDPAAKKMLDNKERQEERILAARKHAAEDKRRQQEGRELAASAAPAPAAQPSTPQEVAAVIYPSILEQVKGDTALAGKVTGMIMSHRGGMEVLAPLVADARALTSKVDEALQILEQRALAEQREELAHLERLRAAAPPPRVPESSTGQGNSTSVDSSAFARGRSRSRSRSRSVSNSRSRSRSRSVSPDIVFG
eukprot:COSAG02_NODE_23743_length_709_cov_1.683607_1_plen_224_part_10